MAIATKAEEITQGRSLVKAILLIDVLRRTAYCDSLGYCVYNVLTVANDESVEVATASALRALKHTVQINAAGERELF